MPSLTGLRPRLLKTYHSLRAMLPSRDRTRTRIMISFWLFGLINNILYVIILSSALDLVGPTVPKGIVLLADVFPSFAFKLVAPYFIHRIRYHHRIIALAVLSCAGIVLIAASPDSTTGPAVRTKLIGVMLASLSSGGGELSFLGLVHYYGPDSLSMWSSGTGGAGIFGAGAYVLSTVVAGLSARLTLFVFAFLPIVMVFTFFVVLPLGPLSSRSGSLSSYAPLTARPKDDDDADDADDDQTGPESQPASSSSSLLNRPPSDNQHHTTGPSHSLADNLGRARALFFPYMLPLLIVYVAEYTINQGVAPTLLFPIADSPFSNYRDFYPTYNAIYQVGVFISRSSRPFYKTKALYSPSLLQALNLLFLTSHALWHFIPSVWLIFIVIFWEGLLGGLVYVTTFAEIRENVPEHDREFSLAATTVSDSGGILISSLISMVVEVWLCDHQVAHGRPYCRMELRE